MRLFLAIEVPKSESAKITRDIQDIKSLYPQFSWGDEKNYHITLYFYGETNKLDKIKEKLEEILYDQEAFYLYSTTADLFMNSKIVIYLNFRREKKIEKLAEKIRETFGEHFGNPKKFVPHLSLARYKIPSKQQYLVLKKRLHRLSIDISFQVKKVYIFQSILGGKKPVYKKLETFSLK